MRDTDGRTTVTLEIEGEEEGDVSRSFEIESIGETEHGWILFGPEGVPRLILSTDELAEIGTALADIEEEEI